jgi:dimethylargininase
MKAICMFTRAIVRPPCGRFADGITSAGLGPPNLEKALQQHERYCVALASCGLALTGLEPDDRYPDSTFVEDAAVLAPRCAVITRPGAESRRGETAAVRKALEPFYETFHETEAPGALDGGDVCEAGEHYFIGLSERTNEDGARQLAGFLSREGYTASIVDVRGAAGLLHLKSGLAYLGGGWLVAAERFAGCGGFIDYHMAFVDPAELYAANCVRVNDRILLAAGYPGIERRLREIGFDPLILDMSEFRKMDGGLSCLSLRF